MVNSSKPMGFAERMRLLTAVMLVSPPAVAAATSGRVILQVNQHVSKLCLTARHSLPVKPGRAQRVTAHRSSELQVS